MAQGIEPRPGQTMPASIEEMLARQRVLALYTTTEAADVETLETLDSHPIDSSDPDECEECQRAIETVRRLHGLHDRDRAEIDAALDALAGIEPKKAVEEDWTNYIGVQGPQGVQGPPGIPGPAGPPNNYPGNGINPYSGGSYSGAGSRASYAGYDDSASNSAIEADRWASELRAEQLRTKEEYDSRNAENNRQWLRGRKHDK